jgi:20S proteasome alpha/beta subunit
MRGLTALLTAAALLAVPGSEPRSKGRFGGTFIGVIVATDGIVIGSDSRSTFLDSDGNAVGYVDRIPKIYASHNAALAAAGLASVEGELFSSFIRRNDRLLDKSADEILHDVALRLPLRNTTNVVMLSAGFVDGDPTICAKIPVEPQSCRNDGYFSNKSSPGLRRWFEGRHGRPASTAEAAEALERAIREAGDLDSAIGGPISLLHVAKDGTLRWIKNPPTDNGWTRVCDIVDAYRSGKAPIFFTNTKGELDHYLDGVCPRSSPRL